MVRRSVRGVALVALLAAAPVHLAQAGQEREVETAEEPESGHRYPVRVESVLTAEEQASAAEASEDAASEAAEPDIKFKAGNREAENCSE